MKKQLLNESEIRKLMKFANIKPGVTNGFVSKLNELHYMSEQEEEDVEDDADPMLDEPAADEPADVDMDEPAGEDVMGDEPAADTDTVLEGVKTVLEALKEGLSGMGLDEAADAITLEVTDEEDVDLGGEDMPVDDMDMDLGAPEEEGPAMADEMPPEEEEEAAALQESQMINEVLTRVVRRLRRASRR